MGVRKIALLVGLLATAPAVAQSPQQDPAMMAQAQCYASAFGLDANQRGLFCDAFAYGLDDTIRLERVDRALSAIPQPSQPNAMLLGARATLLAQSGNGVGAEAAFRDALKIYPDLPTLLAEAVASLTYTDRYPTAADYWFRLERVAPPLALTMDGRVIGELLSRLQASSDFETTRKLIAALDAAGYEPERESRLQITKVKLREAIRAKDRAAIRLAMAKVDTPDQMVAIMADKSFERAWSVVPWSHEERRPQILRDWIVTTMKAASTSAYDTPAAISAVSHYMSPKSAIALYGPLYETAMKQAAEDKLFDYAFWIAPLATAHLLSGDAPGAEKLYRQAAVPMAQLDNAARFNLDANLALLLTDEGRPAEALPIIESAIAGLSKKDPGNRALLPMHAVRARALLALGREAEAASSIDLLRDPKVSPISYIETMLLSGRRAEARDAIVAGLQDDERYSDVLEILQPSFAAYKTSADKRLSELVGAVATDAGVSAALARRGRIVPAKPVFIPEFDFTELRFEGEERP